MKKILSLTLVMTLIIAMTACSKNEEKSAYDAKLESSQTDDLQFDENIDSSAVQENEEASKDSASEENDKETQNDTSSEEQPPIQSTQKPTQPSKPNQSTSNTGSGQPTDKKPEQTPSAPSQDKSTVGNAILSEFKSIIASNPTESAENIANKLLANPVIEFSGGVVPVEEGLLSGFDNTEIKGFSEGVMFAPMIGSIPFVGYVFTTKDSASANSLASTLKSNANLRWNICVEAEEMICHASGNKVLFVMCPKSFE